MWSDTIFDLVFDAINIVYIDSLRNTCIYFDKTCPSIPVKFIDQIKARGATILPSPLSSAIIKSTQSLVVLTGPFHPSHSAITPPKTHKINFQLPISSMSEFVNTCDIQMILLTEMNRTIPLILPINDSAMMVLRSGVKGSRQIRDYLGIMRIGSEYLRGKRWMRDMGVLEDDPLRGCVWQIKADYPVPKIPKLSSAPSSVRMAEWTENVAGATYIAPPTEPLATQVVISSSTSTTQVQLNVAISVNRTTSTYTPPSPTQTPVAGPSQPPPYSVRDPAMAGISSSTFSARPGLDTFYQAGPSRPIVTNFAPFSANTIPLPLPTPAPYPRSGGARNNLSIHRKNQSFGRVSDNQPENPHIFGLFDTTGHTVQIHPYRLSGAFPGYEFNEGLAPRITLTHASPEIANREVPFDYTAPPIDEHGLHPPPIGFTKKARNQIIAEDERREGARRWAREMRARERRQEQWGVWW